MEENVRRFYQESWQGIPFTSFSHISFFHLAEPKFYATFYEELFRRFKDWDDLPAVWRQNKRIDFHSLFLILQKFLNSIDVIRITMCHKNILQFSDPLR